MRLAIAAAMLLTASTPALAQGVEPLRDALATMPEMILGNPAPVQFNFVDVSALRTLGESDGSDVGAPALNRAAVGGMLPPYNALQAGGPEAWNEKSFVDLGEVRYMAGFGEAPLTVSILGLAGEDVAANLIAALEAAGFDAAGPDGIVGNGEPMAMDLSKADPADPWRGTAGAPTFAASKGDAIIQSSMPQPLPVMLAEGPDAAANPAIRAALGGLEAALGEDLLVQAMLVSPAFGIANIDPAALLAPGADFNALRQKLEAEVDVGTSGIPSYFGGFVADVQGDRPAVLFSLAYGDCETAEAAAGLMEQRWRDTMPASVQGEPETGSIEGSDGLCAATLKVSGEAGDGLSNPVFQALFDGYVRREFTVLQIGNAT